MLGIVSGLVVGLISAIIWASISNFLKIQFGYLAILIGVFVGFTVRKFGKGIEPIFGYSGAIISLFSIVSGNILSIIGFIAIDLNTEYFDVLTSINIKYYPLLIFETFTFMDIVFYLLSTFVGYQFSTRIITQKNIFEILRRKN